METLNICLTKKFLLLIKCVVSKKFLFKKTLFNYGNFKYLFNKEVSFIDKMCCVQEVFI
jgi:hypothetical protein